MEDYVEQRDGGYYIAGSRVSLDSIVFLFGDGASPDSIQQDFPTLTLEQVYGAIAFYLGHKTRIDTWIAETGRLWQEQRAAQAPLPPALRQRIDQARKNFQHERR